MSLADSLSPSLSCPTFEQKIVELARARSLWICAPTLVRIYRMTLWVALPRVQGIFKLIVIAYDLVPLSQGNDDVCLTLRL